MIGGALDISYQNGSLRAWLSARLDALVDWCAGTYDITLGITMGVSASVKVWFVHVTVSVEVGVDLHLWGPPLGGAARLHLWFVSFTLDFGAPRPSLRVVTWTDFAKQLPPAASALSLTAVSGRQATPSGDDPSVWYVGTHGFSFASHSAVPASNLRLGADLVSPAQQPLKIRPITVGREGGADPEYIATHTVCIYRMQRDGGTLTRGGQEAGKSWPHAPVLGNVPAALWGSGTAPDVSGDGLVRDRYVGLTVTVPPPQDYRWLPVRSGALDIDPIDPGRLLLDPGLGPQGDRAEQKDDALIRIGKIDMTYQQRDAIFATLQALGCSPTTNKRLPSYARLAAHDLTAPPLIA
jgi:hypothetical protein